jgi:hypothetical protein
MDEMERLRMMAEQERLTAINSFNFNRTIMQPPTQPQFMNVSVSPETTGFKYKKDKVFLTQPESVEQDGDDTRYARKNLRGTDRPTCFSSLEAQVCDENQG